MPQPIQVKDLRAAVAALEKHGSMRAAARALKIPHTTMQGRIETARAKWPEAAPTKEATRRAVIDADVPGAILAEVKKAPGTVSDIASRLVLSAKAARAALASLLAQGHALHERADGVITFNPVPALGSARDEVAELIADKDGWITFGAIGDTHLCSKYERLDCLNDYYDEAERRGTTHVLHAGNWIDGEASFNMHDVHVHGLDAQMRYLAKHYPARKGVATWAITGADHEGWYAARAGVDVGRYAANAMVEAGRQDWRDMGYMEAFVRLRHPASGKSSMLSLMHPGGGSAYAISYAPQKIVEAFDGGDKPAVLIIGHYHKASYQLTRNVHAIQVGCFEDQTPFMRQRKLSAHLGGMFVRVQVDPRTGAVIACQTEFRNYFVKDFYNGRWSHSGPVRLADRVHAA